MEDGERIREILSGHLDLKPAREGIGGHRVRGHGEEVNRGAGHLRDYTAEDVEVTLEELMEEIEETQRK
jgi:hypothetical protein